MKSTGIVRRIDDLGRIVIPKELRKIMKIRDGDTLEYFWEDNNLVLKKYRPYDESFYRKIYETIKNRGYSCAVYDQYNLIRAYGSITAYQTVPDEWIPDVWKTNWPPKNSSFEYEDQKVFPIFVDTDVIGYIAVRNGENTDFVEGVVAMIQTKEEF